MACSHARRRMLTLRMARIGLGAAATPLCNLTPVQLGRDVHGMLPIIIDSDLG